MPYWIDFFIIFLCLLSLFIYKKTRSYVSFKGLALVVIFSFLAFIRFKTIGNPAALGLRFDNFGMTFLPTVAFVILGTTLLLNLRTKSKKFKVVAWLISLASLYLIFGIIQQIFFQSVFAYSLNNVLGNKPLTALFSGIFFSFFHWRAGTAGICFGLMALVAGIFFSYLFLTSPNIILLGLAHAFLASIYYFFVADSDTLERRLSRAHA